MIIQILSISLISTFLFVAEAEPRFTANGKPIIHCADGPSSVRNGCTTGTSYCEYPKVDCHVTDYLNVPRNGEPSEAIGQMRAICHPKNGKCPDATVCVNEENDVNWIKAALGDYSDSANTWARDETSGASK